MNHAATAAWYQAQLAAIEAEQAQAAWKARMLAETDIGWAVLTHGIDSLQYRDALVRYAAALVLR